MKSPGPKINQTVYHITDLPNEKKNRSIIATATGIFLTTLAEDLRLFTASPSLAHTTLELLGWIFMVTGLSFVFYSRLNLVIYNPQTRRVLLSILLAIFLVIYAILYTFICITTAFPSPRLNALIYNVGEKFRILIPVLELVIGGLYIYFFAFFVRDSSVEERREARKIYALLGASLLFHAVSDALLLTLTYGRLYLVRQILITAVYALKLECEVYVLNNLLAFSRKREARLQNLEDATSFEAVRVGPAMLFHPRDRAPCRTDVDAIVPDASASAMSPMSCHAAVETSQSKGKNSIDELERRYLGRYETEKSLNHNTMMTKTSRNDRRS